MADLRPMAIGEILDGALTLYKRHVGLFVRLGVLALWLPIAIQVYLLLAGGGEQHIVLSLIAFILQYFLGLLLTAGVIRIISDSYLGRETRLSEAWSFGASRIIPLFLVGLGKGVLLFLIMLGVGIVSAIAIPLFMRGGSTLAVGLAVLFSFGFVWLFAFVACGYGVTTQVVVLEKLDSSFDAFGRSWTLTSGRKLKVFCLAVVAFIIFVVPLLALGFLTAYLRLTSEVLGQVVGVLAALAPIVITPILPCVFTLMYYDLRVRREAFDLQLLGQQLGIV